MPSLARAAAFASILVLTALGAGAACAMPDPEAAQGLYLIGRAALDDGDGKTAAEYFARAAEADPDALLQDRAFTAALFAGEVHRAAQLAPTGDVGSISLQQLGRATRIVDLIALGDYRQAEALSTPDPTGPHHLILALLGPWAAAGAGDWTRATQLPASHEDRLLDGLARLDQALILERAGRLDQAEAAFRALAAQSDGLALYTGRYGEFLERHGRRPEAIALYTKALASGGANGGLEAAKARAEAAGAPPAAPTIAQGAARALLAPAAMMIAQKQPELGVAYLWLVLRLDPTRDEAWLLAGDALAGSGDLASARAAYLHIQPGGSGYGEASSRLVATYETAGDKVKALELARAAAKAAPDNDEAQLLLADVLRLNDLNAESAQVVDRVITREGAGAGWQVYYMRGVALSEAGQWPAGEKDLVHALALQPDEPEVLNYLGYSWIEHRERLSEAHAMLVKAVDAKPEDGAIIDSLGWAEYQLGHNDAAVERLEKAVELEPAEAEINDHLGDAYWRVGRKLEAKFQWERVLTLNPTPKLRAAVEGKLKSLLGELTAQNTQIR
jgi:tetratricopeptide (TPR) repeat protein